MKSTNKQIDKRKKAIIREIKKAGKIRGILHKDLAEKLGINVKLLTYYFKEFKINGRIRSEFEGRNKRYFYGKRKVRK